MGARANNQESRKIQGGFPHRTSVGGEGAAVSGTPRTDSAKFNVPFAGTVVHEEFAAELEREISALALKLDELEKWKGSAMEVFSRMRLQETGREIGAPLGSDIAAQILPAILDLKRRAQKTEGLLFDCLGELAAGSAEDHAAQDAPSLARHWVAEAARLRAALAETAEKLADWENAASHVESPHPDEVHCGCVPVLRKLLVDARKEGAKWRDRASGSMHSLKEIYNTSCFDWDTMPEAAKRQYPKVVCDLAAEALERTND